MYACIGACFRDYDNVEPCMVVYMHIKDNRLHQGAVGCLVFCCCASDVLLQSA